MSKTSSRAEHGGTHLDAPIHFSADGMTADKVPLRKVVGPQHDRAAAHGLVEPLA